MSYAHIQNLYKDQTILLFKRAYALEKVHGTSAHIRFSVEAESRSVRISFYSGGTSYEVFRGLFDEEVLLARFKEMGLLPDRSLVIYGESYGGKEQGMGKTYGKQPCFIVFDVLVEGKFLSVPDAERAALWFGLEFVPYEEISTDLAEIDAQRDRPSVVAERRGMGSDKMREGIVLRPLINVVMNNGERVCAKHKRPEFSERKTPQPVDPSRRELLTAIDAVVEEWVTPMRLAHVLQRVDSPCLEKTREVILAMLEDVERESAGEIQVTDPKAFRKAVGTKTVKLFQQHLATLLRDE
jgi:hypothetical protein